DHRGTVSQALRRSGEELAALRRLRLDAGGKARASRRRRMPGGARALRTACHAPRMTFSFDPRLTPARPDLAARHLEGKVAAERFVDGEPREVIEPQVPLRRVPAPDAPLDTEALMGERVTVYETSEEGWAWGQLEADGYVGFMPANGLAAPGPVPSHRVSALRTLVFAAPSFKLPPIGALPLGARVAIVHSEGRFARTASG